MRVTLGREHLLLCMYISSKVHWCFFWAPTVIAYNIFYVPDNEKAIYRRAKAHVGAWNPDQAEDDFKRLRSLNPIMSTIIDKELQNIKKLQKEKENEDKNVMKKLFVNEGGVGDT